MKKKVSICVLLIAGFLVLFFTLKDEFNEIINKIFESNKIILFIGLLIYLISLLFKANSLKTFLKEYKSDYDIKKAFNLTLIAQFLNGITPFQTGGQPFMIYLLKKEKVRITDSTKALLKDFLSYQISLVVMGVLAIMINYKFDLIKQNSIINVLLYMGFGINTLVLLVLITIFTAKKTVKKLIEKFINFIFKFKLINKIHISKESIIESLNNFYKAGNEIKENRINMLFGVLNNMLSLMMLYIVPYIIFLSLHENNINLVYTVIATCFIMLVGNFIPIPGATGGIEYSFFVFFTSVTKSYILSGALLLWRFVTYVFGMILGFILLVNKENDIKKIKT